MLKGSLISKQIKGEKKTIFESSVFTDLNQHGSWAAALIFFTILTPLMLCLRLVHTGRKTVRVSQPRELISTQTPWTLSNIKYKKQEHSGPHCFYPCRFCCNTVTGPVIHSSSSHLYSVSFRSVCKCEAFCIRCCPIWVFYEPDVALWFEWRWWVYCIQIT